jgi:predicted nucleic acid-binding protein
MARLIVPDSCALAAAFFHEPCTLHAAPLLSAIRTQTLDAAAPTVMMEEFLNICRKKCKGNSGTPGVSASVVDAIVQDFLQLPIVYFPINVQLTSEAWRLHRGHLVGTFDAYFLLIAKYLDAELWSSDAPFCAHAKLQHPATFDLNITVFK